MKPTGQGGFDITNDPEDACYNSVGSRRCDLCINRDSADSLRCLQHQLLIQNTVRYIFLQFVMYHVVVFFVTCVAQNNTAYRTSFCDGSCPLTLASSQWYSGQNPSTTLTGMFTSNQTVQISFSSQFLGPNGQLHIEETEWTLKKKSSNLFSLPSL